MRKCKINDTKIYVTATWVTNGHVMVRRTYADRLKGKPFKNYTAMGTYHVRAHIPGSEMSTPDVRQVLPKEKGTLVLDLTHKGLFTEKSGYEICAVALESREVIGETQETIYINVDLVNILLECGGEYRCAKPGVTKSGLKSYGPVEVYDGETLTALVMPMRM